MSLPLEKVKENQFLVKRKSRAGFSRDDATSKDSDDGQTAYTHQLNFHLLYEREKGNRLANKCDKTLSLYPVLFGKYNKTESWVQDPNVKRRKLLPK
jgi:hypothetical protein